MPAAFGFVVPMAQRKTGAKKNGAAKPRRFCKAGKPELLVPINLLATLVTLLRLDRERCNRPGIQALQADRFTGFLAIAVGAFVEALQGGVDFGDELPLTIPGAQFDRPVCF